MSIFWCESASLHEFYEKRDEALTTLLLPETQCDGSVQVVAKILETVNTPLDLLSFDDFTLEKCLRNGVSYKALRISEDLRIGHDLEIDAFNERLDAINDKLFNQTKSE